MIFLFLILEMLRDNFLQENVYYKTGIFFFLSGGVLIVERYLTKTGIYRKHGNIKIIWYIN